MERRLSWLELGARPALFPAAFLTAGALCSAEHGFYGALFLVVCGTAGAGALLLRRRTGAHLLLLAAFFLAGVGLSTFAARVEVPARLQSGGTAVVEGRVEQVGWVEDAFRIDLAVSRVTAPETADARFRARLYLRGHVPTILPGQRILAPVRLKPLEPPLNPGQPDFRARQLRRGLLFTGSADPARVVILSPPSSFQVWLKQTHQQMAARVRELAPSPEAAALYLTLAAGLRAELGDSLEATFSASGLAHVLSVSGLHVAVLAIVLLRMLRALLVRISPSARTLDVRRLAAPLAVPLVWSYVIFTGNQMPAVRSAVMATAVLLAMAAWKRADALNSLALAAMALIIFDPSSVADLSTQLSFMAVASLVLISPALRDAIPVARPDSQATPRWRVYAQRLRESVLGTFCASVAVTWASAPFIAYAFQRLSLAGLVSNVVCLPLCGLLTLFAAGGAAVFVVAPDLAGPLFWLGAYGSQALLFAAEAFARLPGASLVVASFGLWVSLVWITSTFGWSLATARWRWIGLAAPVAILLAFVGPRLLPAPGLTVTFLSVGHGDAIVVSSGGKHALIDGGGSPGGGDTGRKYVLPYLRDRGIDSLELAVMSHPHPDHALGLASTLDHIPTRRLWVPAGEEAGELQLRVIAASGDAEVEEIDARHGSFTLGDAVFEVLGPPEDAVLLEGVNDRSIVLRLRHGDVTFLLTGDIEEAGEEVLSPGPITVMKAPHHGSGTSSTERFVEETRPKVVVFCVGRNSRFRFPDDEVEARYRQVGSACYRTDQHGAVTIESDGRDVQVRTFLPATPEPPLLEEEQAPALARGEDHPHP